MNAAGKRTHYPPRPDVNQFGQVDQAGYNSRDVHIMEENGFFSNPGGPALDRVWAGGPGALENLRNDGFVGVNLPLEPNKQTIQQSPQENL